MEIVLQLWGYLILTFLAIVVPIIAILLSIFNKGISRLTPQYENERSQSEANIKNQLAKMGEAKEVDEKAIKESLKKLKAIKKAANIKLSYLNPGKQILKLFLYLLISFIGVIVALLSKSSINLFYGSLAISVICFLYVLGILWKLLGIIIEVRGSLETDKMDTETKIIELLSTIAKKETPQLQYFLKRVYMSIDEMNIKDSKSEVILSLNKIHKLEMGIVNLESRMAKNIQIGLIFPYDFIIEKKERYRIYADKREQIVRYETSAVLGNEHLIIEPLVITALKKGDYNVKTFIKAENIEATNRDLKIKVT